MEEKEYSCLNCGSPVTRVGSYYRCFGCGENGDIADLIKKQSELEKKAQSSNHPFGEWRKKPLPFS